MYKTKKEVDAYACSELSKILSFTERHLRNFTIAKLYYEINEFATAEQYLCPYLSVKEDNDQAHKLLGQCYQHLKKPDKALQSFQRSLQLNPKQSDILAEVCQLLLEDKNLNTNKANYWCELAESEKVQHEAVFALRFKLMNKENLGTNQVEELIQKEIAARPNDVQLRVRLVRNYVEKNQILDAFKYVHQLEMSQKDEFVTSGEWYNIVWLVLNKYEQMPNTKKDWDFWLLLAICLERQVQISFSLPSNSTVIGGGVTETANLLFNLDQYLFKISQLSDKFCAQKELVELFLDHYRGQLLLHASALIFKRGRFHNKSQWKETTRAILPLLLLAFQIEAPNSKEPWMKHCDEQSKQLINLWQREGSFRCAQVGRTLLSCVDENGVDKENAHNINNLLGSQSSGLWQSNDELLNQVRQTCSDRQWRRNIFALLFCNSDQKVKEQSSLFAKSSKLSEPIYEMPSYADVECYEDAALYLRPQSLQHMVYLCLGNENLAYVKAKYFSGLNYSTQNLSFCGAESLNQLDVDSFLYAATIQAKRALEVDSSALGKPKLLPFVNIHNMLCTKEQSQWWSAAYIVYKNLSSDNDLAELRENLQYGIEAVRGINGPKLDMTIVFKLGQIFVARAQDVVEPIEKAYLEARAESIYKYGLNMMKMPNESVLELLRKYFKYVKSQTPAAERALVSAAEDAVSYLATRYFKKSEYEDLIEELCGIQLPFATYMQAEAYRKLAEASKTPKKNKLLYINHAIVCLNQTLALSKITTHSDHLLHSFIESEIKRLQQTSACYFNESNMNFSPITGHEDTDTDFYTENSMPSVYMSNTTHSRRDISSATAMLPSHNQEIEAFVKQISNTLTIFKNEIINNFKSELQNITKEICTLKDKISCSEEAIRKITPWNDGSYQKIQQSSPPPHMGASQSRNNYESITSRFDMISNSILMSTLLTQPSTTTMQFNKPLNNQPVKKGPSASPFANFTFRKSTAPSSISKTLTTTASSTVVSKTGATITSTTSPFASIFSNLSSSSFINPTSIASSVSVMPTTVNETATGGCALNKSSTSDTEDDYVPTAQFNPVIPLPDLVEVNTGEENEIVLFEHRAKLLRFDKEAGEWKERGLGNIKLLQDKDDFNKVRLVMRREQIHKLCCNQRIYKDTSFKYAKNSQTALTWAGQDFSENELVTEMLTVRFKLPETCKQFLEAIHNAQAKMTSEGEEANSKINPTSIASSVSVMPTTVNETATGGSALNKSSTSDTEVFSAASSLTTISAGTQSQSSTVIITPTTLSNSTEKFYFELLQFDASQPVVVDKSATLNVSSIPKGEEVVFSHIARLFHVKDMIWKDSSIGDITILKSNDGTSRILIRRDQTLNICANHKITHELTLNVSKNDTKGFIWTVNDLAEGSLKLKKFYVRFKSQTTALGFQRAFKRAQKEAKDVQSAMSANNVQKLKVTSPSTSNAGTPFALTKSTATKFMKYEDSLGSQRPKVFGKRFLAAPATTLSTTASTSKSLFSDLNLSTKILSSNVNSTTGASPFTNFTFRNWSKPSGIFSTPTATISSTVSSEAGAAISSTFANISTQFAKNLKSIRKEAKEKQSVMLAKNVEKSKGTSTRKSNTGRHSVLAKSTATNFIPSTPAPKNEYSLASQTQKVFGKSIFAATATAPSIIASTSKSLFSDLNVSTKISSSSVNSAKPTAVTTSAFDNFSFGNWSAPSGISSISTTTKTSKASTGFGSVLPSFGSSAANDKNKSIFGSSGNTSQSAGNGTRSSLFGSSMNTSGFSGSIFGPSSTNLPQFDSLIKESNPVGTFADLSKTSTASTDFSNLTTKSNSNASGSLDKASTTFADLSKTATASIDFASLVKANTNTNLTSKSNEKSGFIGLTNQNDFSSFGKPLKELDSLDKNSPASKINESQKSVDGGGEGGEGAGDSNDENYDPHYDPIIELPNEIVVSTGEEEETKLFGERAVLYRWDATNKEWKERGVGELKILLHPVKKSYRLVMRREQIHKLVLNQAVNADFHFNNMNNNPESFVWATINYAESSEGELEKLAVRFKKVELAVAFSKKLRECIDNCKEREKTN